jgi:transposase
MRTPTKFVKELSNEQKSRLQAIMKSDAPQRTRMRAHAVLLSARRFSIDRIADVYEVDRDRVSQWLKRWGEFGIGGLADEARAGRPPKLSLAEQARAVEIVGEEPRSVRRAVAEIDRRLKKN